MNENYTAEDFARATLATKGEHGVARRTDPRGPHQWHVCGAGYGWFTDEEMAACGWEPVVESRVTEHTLRDSQENAARKREKLVDHIADQDRVIRRRNDEIAALRERVRVAESGRLSLDRLEAAWETAETIDSTGIREGDLCIERCAERHFEVFRADADVTVWHDTIRILSRAPKREPWQDLADALRGTVWERLSGDVDGLAAAVHAAGWRKGGDES